MQDGRLDHVHQSILLITLLFKKLLDFTLQVKEKEHVAHHLIDCTYTDP
jgi:hypothetical protein